MIHLVVPIHLTGMFIDCGRVGKPGEAKQTQGEHAPHSKTKRDQTCDLFTMITATPLSHQCYNIYYVWHMLVCEWKVEQG